MNEPPRIFVGSAAESLHVAVALQSALGDVVECLIWPDAFGLGALTLDDIADAAADNDFAVFVFSPDDDVESRGERMKGPRDNVLFELGLFSGTMGRRRAFVVKAEAKSVKVPSDLAGVTYATYKAPNADADDARWVSALRPAAGKIKAAITREKKRVAAASAAADKAGVPVSGSAALVAGAIADAQRGRLSPLSITQVGAIVVHPLHGVGQVIGFDPIGDGAQILRVRFDAGLAAVPKAEMYDAYSHLTPPDQ